MEILMHVLGIVLLAPKASYVISNLHKTSDFSVCPCTHAAIFPNHSLPLRCGHNDCDGVSNHQPHGCCLNRLFRHKSKKTSKFRVVGLCAVTGEFPAQRASNAENVLIWCRRHALRGYALNRRLVNCQVVQTLRPIQIRSGLISQGTTEHRYRVLGSYLFYLSMLSDG